jgi:chitinase
MPAEPSDPLAGSVQVTPTEPTPSFRIIGYVTDLGPLAGPEQVASLTHINYAFALPTREGHLHSVANAWKLDDYVEQAHANGAKVLISIGGWGWDAEFEALAAAEESRRAFVEDAMGIVDEFGLDGVDVDWEYPDPGPSSENFRALMNDLHAELEPRGELLTAAVAAVGSNADGIPDDVFPMVDFLNLMAYDGPGPEHSPLSYAEETLAYWTQRGLPPEQRVLGVPFYASPGDIPYRKLLAQDPAAADADRIEHLGTPVGYNGVPTMRAKTRLALEQASGMMVWTIPDDAPGEHSLLETIVNSSGGSRP